MRRWMFGFVACSGIAAFVVACGVGNDCDFGLCAGATAGIDGGDAMTTDGPSDGPSDPCIETPTDARCLDESTALFVSTSKGNDQDALAGSREKPFKTIGVALGRVTPARRRIYVCEGTYPEDLKLGVAHSKVSIFGGIDCAWKTSAQSKPVIGASANPLRIDGASGISIASIAVEAQDAAKGSSIAVFASGAEVTFRSVRIVAGKAAVGDEGMLVPFTYPPAMDLKGNDSPDTSTGGPAKPYTCPGGAITTGGKGGKPGFNGESGLPGTPNGGVTNNCVTDVTGHPGSTPAVGAGANALGDLTAGGWTPKSGANGANGAPGQGGGGGYGNGGGGGGGAAGACGGAGGAGGAGGGASIAVASFSSRLTFTVSVLTAKDAGRGGAGALGQIGSTDIGAGGVRSGLACTGGNGGIGGDGSAGGGGAGGISVGVLYKNTKPTRDSATEQATKAGAKGAAGAAAPGATNAGVDGVAELSLEAK